MKEVLKWDKERLLSEVVDVLKVAEFPLTGNEIARRILVKHFGENWYKKAYAHSVMKSLSMRVIQNLGVRDNGEKNRKRLGIEFTVASLPNCPLAFFLKKQG